MRKLIVLMSALVVGVVQAALVDAFTGGTVYVDPAHDAVGDGSAANPYRSLQTAVQNAPALAKIVLAAGRYETGSQAGTLGGHETLARAVLTKKLYLKGAGSDLTVIVGAPAANPTADGLGTGAVRGILATDAAAGSILEGLTITGGRTLDYDETQTTTDSSLPNIRERKTSATNQLAMVGRNLAACGGGVYFTGASRATADLVTMVDCAVEDCRAGFAGGALYGNIRLVRCYVATSYAMTFQGGTIARVPVAFSSIFAGNGKTLKDVADTVHAAPASYSTGYLEGVFVNCTFNGNLGGGLPHTRTKLASGTDANSGPSLQRFQFYNSIFFVHGSGLRHVTGGVECYNCCQNMYGSLKNVTDYIRDAQGNKIVRDATQGTYWVTNSIGNVGSDYYPRLDEDKTGTTWSASPAVAGSETAAFCPQIQFGRYQFVGGMGRNCRLRTGSILINYGDTKWFTGATSKATLIPAEYLDKDFYGEPRVKDGQVDQGACEGGYTGAEYTVNVDSGCSLYVDDCYYAGTVIPGVRPGGLTGTPMTWRADVGNGELYGYSTTSVSNNGKAGWGGAHAQNYRYLYPDFRGTTVRILAEDPAQFPTITYQMRKAPSVKWVSPDGSDDNAGTEAAPYRTLQKAVDASSDFGVVLAKQGVYAEGGKADNNTTDADWVRTTGSRVEITKNIRLVGVEGADETVILGASADPDAQGIVNTGCGKGARRCIAAGGQKYVSIQGFTLTGGHTDSDPVGQKKSRDADVTAYNWSGAGVTAQGYNSGHQTVTVSDCVISNNVAYHAAALQNVIAVRCVITDNATVDRNGDVVGNVTNELPCVWSAIENSMLVNCMIYGNDRAASTVVDNSNGGYASIVNCFFCETNVSPVYGGQVYNSIFWQSKAVNGSVKGRCNIVWGGSEAGWKTTSAYAAVDPFVQDSSVGKFRLPRCSPAVTAGLYHADPGPFGLFYYFEGIHGGWPVYDAQGRTAAGCYQDFAPTWVQSETIGARGNCMEPASGVLLEEGESVTCYARPNAEATAGRKFLGYEVNGVMQSSIPAEGITVTAGKTPILRVAATFATNIYANASRPDDTGDGWTPETAKRTLNAALDLAIAGDVVHAAEGVYDDGARQHDMNLLVRSVAIVPDGVSLVADGALGKTVIEGAWGTHIQNLNGQNIDFGDDAIRCAKMGENTRLKGFTLHNGGTANDKRDDDVTATPNNDRIGGGVFGTATTVYEDCCFSNLCAVMQAAFSGGGTAIRCTFIRVGTSGNNVTDGAAHYHCFIDESFDALFANARAVKGCTFGPNNRVGFNGSMRPGTLVSLKSGGVLENSILLSESRYAEAGASNNLRQPRNCIFNVTQTNAFRTTVWGAGCQFMTVADMMVNADGTLQKDSPAIDAGLNEGLEKGLTADCDLGHGQRIYNGTVDVGAYEYDWRHDYTKTLKHPWAMVTAASEGVEKVAAGIRLDDGCTFHVNWPGSGSMYVATFVLSDGDSGTLTVTNQAGETLGTYGVTRGEQVLEIAKPTDDMALTFAYAGTGNAVLKPFATKAKLFLYIR